MLKKLAVQFNYSSGKFLEIPSQTKLFCKERFFNTTQLLSRLIRVLEVEQQVLSDLASFLPNAESLLERGNPKILEDGL